MKKPGAKNGSDAKVLQAIRSLGVLVEDNNHKLGVVAEQVGSLTEKINILTDNLIKLTEKVADLADTVAIIKTDIELIKAGLKKKVDYDEFVALEKRVSLVESKMRR